MIRTAIAVVVLLGAIVWLPLWLQLLLLLGAVIVVPYKLTLFVPAVFADALYAPGVVSVAHLKYTLITALLLVLYWILITKTRINEIYAVQKS